MEGTLLFLVLAWSGIQFGTLWIMFTSILPMLNGLGPDRYPDTCQRIDMRMFHPIALWGGILSIVVAIYTATQLEETGAQIATVAGAAMMLAVGLISEGKNRPIWRMIEKWQTNTMPSNWERLRSVWDLAHRLRTLAAFLATVLFATAAIVEFA